MVREAERGECVGAGQSELQVPQDHQVRFRTELCERSPRSEQALVAALAAMYVQGVSTRQVKAITEAPCGHQFSSATISRATQALDEELARFAQRRLEEPYPYLILDTWYEQVREAGVNRLPAAAPASPALEEHQRAGATQGRDQAAHAGGADLP